MSADYFAPFEPIRYQGPDAKDDLAYRWYDKDKIVLGKRMEDHLRFAVCFWHTFCWPGSDVFGAGTFSRPWHAGPNDAAHAKAKREAALAFVEKLDLPFYCFHDVDVMADAGDVASFRRSFAEAVDHLEALQAKHKRKLLWGTANLFSHPRYMAGAATNPNPEIFAWAAMQVRDCLEATHRLGGANYVLWGGREGYDTILNTELGTEQENFGRFLSLVVAHKHKIGFKGAILIEPKPHEPTKHQYDFDTQTVYGFLKRFGLENEVKVNIEANHATLSGHTFEHEIAMSRALGLFGSIDANRGDHQNGWDTDQFPNSVEELTLALLEIIRAGGFTTGGFNFDAKVRRQSIDAADLFHGHIGGIDTIAHALLKAEAIIKDGRLDAFRKERYAGWKGELGKTIHAADASLASIADLTVKRNLAPQPASGRQEWLENLVQPLLMLELEAGEYRLAVDPARGGSIARFDWRGEALMRPACGPSVLDTACFPLVPFSNRIAHGRFTANGRAVHIAPNLPGSDHPHPLHGFGWLKEWRVLSHDARSAALEHIYPGGAWPWAYRAVQSFSLAPEGLTMKLALQNLSETPMPAGLGFHPYFPRAPGTLYRGLHRGEWRNSDDCLPLTLEEKSAPADWWGGRPVGSRAVDTVYTGRAGDLHIAWPERGIGVAIAPSENLGFTVVYTPPGAAFFCVEPVTHMTDAVNSARGDSGLVWLEPSASMAVRMTLTARPL